MSSYERKIYLKNEYSAQPSFECNIQLRAFVSLAHQKLDPVQCHKYIDVLKDRKILKRTDGTFTFLRSGNYLVAYGLLFINIGKVWNAARKLRTSMVKNNATGCQSLE